MTLFLSFNIVYTHPLEVVKSQIKTHAFVRSKIRDRCQRMYVILYEKTFAGLKEVEDLSFVTEFHLFYGHLCCLPGIASNFVDCLKSHTSCLQVHLY